MGSGYSDVQRGRFHPRTGWSDTPRRCSTTDDSSSSAALHRGHGGSAALIWDPTTDRFVSTGSMSAARSGHTATRLSDGRVLVVGGAPTLTATRAVGGDHGPQPPGPSRRPGRALAGARVTRRRCCRTTGCWSSAAATPSSATRTSDSTSSESRTRPPRLPSTGSLAAGRAAIPRRCSMTAGYSSSAEATLPRRHGGSSRRGLGSRRQRRSARPERRPTARGNHTATLLHDGRVLVVGSGGYFVPVRSSPRPSCWDPDGRGRSARPPRSSTAARATPRRRWTTAGSWSSVAPGSHTHVCPGDGDTCVAPKLMRALATIDRRDIPSQVDDGPRPIPGRIEAPHRVTALGIVAATLALAVGVPGQPRPRPRPACHRRS